MSETEEVAGTFAFIRHFVGLENVDGRELNDFILQRWIFV